ncbi:MAG: DUF3179 domain-containing (seleno)protein [Candidatus Uhrbacteria bacterium]
MIRLQLPKIRPVFIVIILILLGVFIREYFVHRPPEILAPASFEEIVIDSGVDNDSMPAINESVFESVAAADTYLENDGLGIALTENKIARFFPFQILVWHHLVNDVWGRVPILVSYNPLCGNSGVFESYTSEGILHFENSGQVLNNSFLMTDKNSGSLWNPLSGQAISGTKTGQSLHRLNSTVMTWNSFKKNFSDGEVLSRETGFTRDYSKNPYGDYFTSPDILFPLSKYDASLSAKTLVYSYGSLVYPEDNIKNSKSIVDEVDGKKISLLWDEDWQTVRGFELAEDGSLVDEVPLVPMYWMCWLTK